jgi:hypothetical protein
VKLDDAKNSDKTSESYTPPPYLHPFNNGFHFHKTTWDLATDGRDYLPKREKIY